MTVGLEVVNDNGLPVLVNAHSYVFFASGKNTVSIGSNTDPFGTTGRVTLPAQSVPYLVFIRCNGGSTIITTSVNGFDWTMAQGTTSFEWWAWGRAVPSGNVGMQVFNPDGSIQWDLTNRPLCIVGMVNKAGGAVPSFTEAAVDNVRAGPVFNGPGSNLAYMLSDVGTCYDLYSYSGSGGSIRANMRFYPGISTPNASQIQLNYIRRRANRNRPLVGASYSSFLGQLPNFILAAKIY